MKNTLLILLCFLTSMTTAETLELPPTATHGEWINTADGPKVYYQGTGVWLSPEGFWHAYTEQQGGLTWGEGTEYPDYNQVNELDTFLVVLEQGKCLMEFFHGRWRRAQDVRRWNPAFNDYGGCPHVFGD